MTRKKPKKPEPPEQVFEIPIFVDLASDFTYDIDQRIVVEKRLDQTYISLPHPHAKGMRIVGIVIPDSDDDWVESPNMIIHELLSEAEQVLINDGGVH